MLKFLRSPTTIIVLLAGIAGVALVLYAWRLPPFHSSVEMTENAYVRGYVTIMSPQLSGYVADVQVRDYETVKAGQLLVKIDDRIYAQKLAQAEATLAGQKAALANSYQQELSAKAATREARARDAELAMREYEAQRLAVLAKTARLRALRLAKEAGEAAHKAHQKADS